MSKEREAGRELDALVAEKVMGWRPITHLSGEPVADGWVGFWDGDWFRWTTRPESDEPDASKEWLPSTSIADAWLVVEKYEHFKMWRNPFTKKFSAEFYTEFGKRNKWAASADTAPEAICLAALKAVGA